MTRRFWTEGAGSFIIAIFAALVVRWAFLEAYVIPSGSMLPTLLINDHIFVNKIIYGLRVPFTEKWLVEFSHPDRGDIVVFKFPENRRQFYIKRIVGLPGDRVFYENGNLYVNDQLIEKTVPGQLASDFHWVRDQDFPGEAQSGGKKNFVHWEENLGERNYSVLLRAERPADLTFGPYTVPPRHYFVLGDNRDNSQDSRAWDFEALRAQGKVRFFRQAEGQPITIPNGTIVRTDQPGRWVQRFRTTAEVVLSELSAEVPVEAVEPGLLGNVKAGEVRVIEADFLGVQVANPEAMSGGVDKRFVPRENLVGRANRVWLSCEKTLPVMTFLCNPFYIRWGRLFHAVR